MNINISQLVYAIPEAIAWIYYAICDALRRTIQKITVTASLVFAQITQCFREMEEIATILGQEYETLRGRFKKQELSSKLLCELALKSAPNKEAYYQILVQDAAYLDWSDGTILMPSEHFVNPLYQIKKTIEFPHGIKALIITSEDSNEPPIIAFRGTNARNIHNLMDDLNTHIGELNCTEHERELENELETLAIEHGRVHIIGHSYGGAVAQRLTARFPQYIARSTYHNAPSVGESVVQEYRHNTAQITPFMDEPLVVSFRHAKDPVSLLGGSSLPTAPHCNFTTGTSQDRISHIDSHSFNTLSTGALVRPYHAVAPGLERFANFAEQRRRSLSQLIPLYRLCR